MAHKHKIVRFLYKKLLSFYPQEFKERLGESMEQTFKDLLREKWQHNEGTLLFVLWSFIETATGIFHEHILLLTQGGTMSAISTNPKAAAFTAFLLTLPFMILNTIAANQIEPLYTIFKVNTAGSFWDYPVGHISLLVVLLLFPLGATISIRPMLQKTNDGERKFYFVNILLAVIMVGFFVLISGALLEEIYRCNIIGVLNCD